MKFILKIIMASAGCFKPLLPTKISMDTSKAMAIFGFPSSQGFENTEMEDIQKAFLAKIQKFEALSCKPHPRAKVSKRDEIRRVNEAYQYLIRKRRKLTGRAMTDNWQIVGGKSNTAMDIISTLKGGSGFTNPLMSSQKKQIELDMKKQQEEESANAKALAAEVVTSAGLERPLGNVFVGQSLKSGNQTSTAMPLKVDKRLKLEYRSHLLIEEKVRRPSAFTTRSYPETRHSLFSTKNHRSLPFINGALLSDAATCLNILDDFSRIHPKRNSKKVSGKRRTKSIGGSTRRQEVVVSMSGLFAKTTLAKDDLEKKAFEDVGIRMVRKALSTLNLF